MAREAHVIEQHDMEIRLRLICSGCGKVRLTTRCTERRFPGDLPSTFRLCNECLVREIKDESRGRLIETPGSAAADLNRYDRIHNP